MDAPFIGLPLSEWSTNRLSRILTPCVRVVVISSFFANIMIIRSGQRGNMTLYSNELKASIIQKMMPPQNVPIAQLAQKTAALNEAELAEYCCKNRL
jgi:hypothetical protein